MLSSIFGQIHEGYIRGVVNQFSFIIYKFFPKFLLSKLIALVTSENSKMKVVTSVE